MSNTTILARNLQGTYGTLYYVKNMDESVQWYKTLGLIPSIESPEWTEFSIKGHSLCLHPVDTKDPKKTSGFLILRVVNIKNVVADLAKQGVTILQPVQEVCPDSKAYCANISDRDGNIISLYEGP